MQTEVTDGVFSVLKKRETQSFCETVLSLMTLPSCVQHSELTSSPWQPRAPPLAAPKAELADGEELTPEQGTWGHSDTTLRPCHRVWKTKTQWEGPEDQREGTGVTLAGQCPLGTDPALTKC